MEEIIPIHQIGFKVRHLTIIPHNQQILKQKKEDEENYLIKSS